MYFSGHMLDNFSRHCADINSINMSELLAKDESGSYLYSERDRVTICGMISSLTLKTTKNQEQMAFFQLEDKYASCECIVFAKRYAELYPDILVDNAVCIEGTVSIRDEEAPKILVNDMYSLSENDRYVTKQSEEKPRVQSSQQSSSAISADSANEALNMYLSIYQNASVQQQPAQKEQPTPIKTQSSALTAPQNIIPTKIFVRVPDMSGEIFLKAKNLIDIFSEGTIRVIFYDSSAQKYSEYSEKLSHSNYVSDQLCKIVGKGNIVLK